MPLADGEMQHYALTLDKILEHAAKWHPQAQVVTARKDRTVDRIGYADLRDRAKRFTAILLQGGVRPGEHVATLAWNTQSHIEAWYAIMGMGAVCHTLNPRLTVQQLASMIEQSNARVLVVSGELLPLALEVAARAPGVQEILADSLEGEQCESAIPVRSLDRLIEAAGSEAEVIWGEFDENASCGLCFTSGTTGKPKGVTYTHRSNFLHTLRALQADVMGLTVRDVALAAVPMFHANGWGLPFVAPAVGAKLVLPGRNTDGETLARLIAMEEVTIAIGVPTVWLGLLDHVQSNGINLPSLKKILVGGAPMPPALMDRLQQVLGVTVVTSWGMTELSPLGVMAHSDDLGRNATKSGRPAIGIDFMVADHDGAMLPQQRGTEGLLHVRGPAVVERYFGCRESATHEGWFNTGDLAVIDEDGQVSITGRAKDLIKSGGEWINPAEIELLVSSLPQVSFAAVIGMADPKWGERPLLLVQLLEGETINDEELLQPLHGQVASWWIPDKIIRVVNMPLASTGKIDKMKLRHQYSAA